MNFAQMRLKRIMAGMYEIIIDGQLYTFKDSYSPNSNSTNNKTNRWAVIRGEYGTGKGLYWTHSLNNAKHWLIEYINKGERKL